MVKVKEIELHAGHWNNVFSGATGLINEVVENRKVGKRVYEILKSKGVPVTYFEDDESDTVSENIGSLVKHHNQDRNGLVVSIHFNASSGKSVMGIGTEVLYYDEKELAETLANAISKATNGGLKNRGAKERKDLGVLKKTYEPAIIIEVCFVNSSVDVNLYRKHFEDICHAIANELAKTVDPNVIQKPAKKDDGLYQVVAGTFQKYENAEEMSKTLKSKGFANYIQKK